MNFDKAFSVNNIFGRGKNFQLLKNLVDKRKLITVIFASIWLVTLLLYLILGSGEDKVFYLVMGIVAPAFIYFGARLIFNVVRIHASMRYLNFAVWFFLVVGTLAAVVDVKLLITDFLGSFSPTMGCCMALIVAVLAEAKKNLEVDEENK